MSTIRDVDPLDMEFQYYCSLFEDLFLSLKTKCEQYDVNKWNRKLTDPTYNADALRDKRNHYMLMLTLTLTLETLKPPFNKPPPDGSLPEIQSIKSPCTYGTSPKPRMVDITKKACDFHTGACPPDKDMIIRVLDNQFTFLMKAAKSTVGNLYDISDRGRARDWIKFLTNIDTKCVLMKGVRNDYAMLLAGYLVNEELLGPFVNTPIDRLIALNELVRLIGIQNHMFIDPTSARSSRFLKGVPTPKEGAFAFLALTGDIAKNAQMKKC